jgi:hypothetical protein
MHRLKRDAQVAAIRPIRRTAGSEW